MLQFQAITRCLKETRHAAALKTATYQTQVLLPCSSMKEAGQEIPRIQFSPITRFSFEEKAQAVLLTHCCYPLCAYCSHPGLKHRIPDDASMCFKRSDSTEEFPTGKHVL